MIFSAHSNNRTKDILILDESITQIVDTTLTPEKTYSINFTKIERNSFLSLHYNGDDRNAKNSNGKEIIKFKAKDSEIISDQLCLGNISNNFSCDNMERMGLYRNVYDFSVDYRSITVDDILDIHK